MITDEKLVDNYQYMFEMPAWKSFMASLDERIAVLDRVSTLEPGESMEVRQARLKELQFTRGFESLVRGLIHEAAQEGA